MMKKTGGRAKNGRTKKSKQQLDYEGRLRKKQKKHHGHPAGSRTGSASAHAANNSRDVVDLRIGSKKPVSLIGDQSDSESALPVQPAVLSAEQQLQQLEEDPRLASLLDKLDAQQTISATEQQYVERQLDKIEKLMEQLGLVVDDEPDVTLDEQQKKEDLFRFLQNDPQRRQ